MTAQSSKSGIELKLKKVALLFQKTANNHEQSTIKPIKIDPKANLEIIMDTFQNHKSVQKIEVANFHSKSSLKLNSVSELDVRREILFQKIYQKR